MEIGRYFASLGFDVSKKDISKVDKALDNVESRLKLFGQRTAKYLKLNLQIENFTVDQARLNRVLGNALDVASTRTVFEVSRFSINQAALNRDVSRAMGMASQSARVNVHTRTTGMAARERATGAARGPRGGLGFAGFYGPALALGAGGYGLSALNQRNQQVVSAQLQSQAVVQQAGGTAGQGQESFEWLRKESNRVGFNYLDASGDYNRLLSGLTGAGMSVQQGQGVFKGFSELSRVNKLDRTAQTRVYRALSQIAGKNKLQSEELTGQLAESLPGAVSIFARAYQAKLTAEGKGGGKVGQEAISELLAAMKKGQVKGDILTYAGDIASAQAQPGLAKASTASQAEQARYQNVVSDMSVLASNNGVEEGFARIFRTLSTGLSESNGMVKTLAESFNQATIDASKLLLFPQSFMRALEGRDSLVADWLGADKTAQLIADYSQIKALFDDIAKSIGGAEWSPSLKATAEEIAGIMRGIASLGIWKQRTADTRDQIYQDQLDAGAPEGKAIAKAAWFTFKSTIMPWNANEYAAEYGTQRMADMGQNIDPVMGASGLDVDAYWNYVNSQAKDYSLKQFGPQGYGASPSSANAFESGVDTYKQGSSLATTNENKFDVNVVLQSGDPDEISKYFKTQFQSDIDTAMLHFEEK